jgi:hypothetical protein
LETPVSFLIFNISGSESCFHAQFVLASRGAARFNHATDGRAKGSPSLMLNTVIRLSAPLTLEYTPHGEEKFYPHEDETRDHPSHGG